MTTITRSPLFRISVSVTTSASLLIATTGQGFSAAFDALSSFHLPVHVRPLPALTGKPGKPLLGANPGRFPLDRGGWNPRLSLEMNQEAGMRRLSASTRGAYFWLHTLAVSAGPGNSYPWEGSAKSPGSSTNTANGDKLTRIPLFSWKMRGGKTFDVTLYHNSETNYSDELGNGWTWTYDIYINNISGNPVVHWGDGLCVPYTAVKGSYTPPAGVYDQLASGSGGTWTVTTKDQTVYHFDSAGFCDTVTDQNGNQVKITYNSGNYVTSISDPSGRTVSFSLDSKNRFSSITDPMNHVWDVSYDTSDNLQQLTWPSTGDGNTYTDQFTYNSLWDMLTHTDRRGNVWTCTYNSDGSLNSESDPLGDAISYNYQSGYTQVTDARGNVRTDNYSGGALSSQTDNAGYSVNYVTRDGNFNVTKLTDQRNNTWLYTYDSMGNTLTKTDPFGNVTTFTYNSFNEPLTVKDALGNQASLGYDSNGNLTSWKTPLGNQTDLSYDAYGDLLSSTDPLGKQTTMTYDSNGDLASVVDPDGVSTDLVYDALGRLTSKTDDLLNKEQYAYDAWGRLVQTTHADNSTQSWTYDGNGNCLSFTDEDGNKSTSVFDAANRLTSKTNGRGDAESYVCDKNGNVTSVTNGNGDVRTATFDARNEEISSTLADSSEEQWSYDGCGNTTAYENPLAQTIYYTFDADNRETAITYPSGTNVAFGYDADSHKTSMTDSTGSTDWTFDSDSRVTQLATPYSTLTYAFDADARKTSLTQPGVGTTSYVYTPGGRLQSETNAFNEKTAWTFDGDGRISTQTYSTGQVETFGYDARSRVTSLSQATSGSSSLWSESYVYDGAGNLSSKTVNSVKTTYEYDGANQLVSEAGPSTTIDYAYDANGNRTSRTVNGVKDVYTYDKADKLLSTSSKTYGYDAAGRVTSVVSSAGTTSISYDYEDRVTSVKLPSGTTDNFTYNGLDTRMSKSDSTGNFTFVRDGASPTAPVLTDAYATYTPGISDWRGTGHERFYGLDREGTNSVETDLTQSVQAAKTFDAFGNLVSMTGSSSSPFGYIGGLGYQTDSDTGLMLLGHRYYDPSTGRFLTRDHAKAGRNWYDYANNNPLKEVDPSGKGWQTALVVLWAFLRTVFPPGGPPSPHIEPAVPPVSQGQPREKERGSDEGKPANAVMSPPLPRPGADTGPPAGRINWGSVGRSFVRGAEVAAGVILVAGAVYLTGGTILAVVAL